MSIVSPFGEGGLKAARSCHAAQWTPLVALRLGYGQSLAARNGLTVMTTIDILKIGVRTGHSADRGEMRKLYGQLKSLDDGLVDIVQTDLLHKDTWSKPAPPDEPTNDATEAPSSADATVLELKTAG